MTRVREIEAVSQYHWSRDSVVGIETDYGMDDREIRARVPVGLRISFFHVVQTGSGAHPTDHSPPTSAEVKKMWIYRSTPPYTLMA
jgi:hypothetical protein